jgi:hypothetical protein
VIVRPGALILSSVLACSLFACSDDSGTGALRGNSELNDDEADRESGSAAPTASGSTPSELCFNTINAYREQAGLPAYARWTTAETCADGQAKSDASSGRAHGAFTRCDELAQNECPGTRGTPTKALPACLRAMWNEGPGGGHHDAMASTKYTKVACGVFATSSGATWSVQNFR